MTTLAPDVMSRKCASRAVMVVVASKWSLLVINALGNEARRNGVLLRAVDGISQKMLTQTLRQLEELQVVVRHDHQTVPPYVEYALTPLGRSLRHEVSALIRWVEGNLPSLLNRR